MPYTEVARRFFNLCAHNPSHARGKCPKDAKKLAAHANAMPTKPPVRKKR